MREYTQCYRRLGPESVLKVGLGRFAIAPAEVSALSDLPRLRHRSRVLQSRELTTDEQRLILRATAENVHDHTIISLAFGTGLRLAEIVGLNVGDAFASDCTPRLAVRVRAAIVKGGRAADVFLPDRLVAN